MSISVVAIIAFLILLGYFLNGCWLATFGRLRELGKREEKLVKILQIASLIPWGTLIALALCASISLLLEAVKALINAWRDVFSASQKRKEKMVLPQSWWKGIRPQERDETAAYQHDETLYRWMRRWDEDKGGFVWQSEDGDIRDTPPDDFKDYHWIDTWV